MAHYPALPLWTDAHLADTTHLSDAEHGRYMLLIMHMWRTPGCRLPNDDAWLARKLNRSIEDVQRDIRPLLREFFLITGNWFYQTRLQRERKYIEGQRAKHAARAKARYDQRNSGDIAPEPRRKPKRAPSLPLPH